MEKMVKIIIKKRHIVLALVIVIMLTGLGFVIGFKEPPDWERSDSAVLGHSVDEFDWEQVIQKVNADEICLPSGDENCRTTWPSPSIQAKMCPEGQAIVSIENGVPKCGLKPLEEYEIMCGGKAQCTIYCEPGFTLEDWDCACERNVLVCFRYPGEEGAMVRCRNSGEKVWGTAKCVKET